MSRVLAGLILTVLCLPAQASALVDGWGRSIEVPTHPPLRIAALAPHLVESLFALGLGDRVVATVSFADHPPAAQDLPRVGDAFALSWEALAAARPDWILVWGAAVTPARLARLEASGVPVYVSEPRSLAAVATELKVLTAALGGAADVAERFQRRLDALPGPGAVDAYRVLPLISAAPPMTLSEEHFVNDLLAHCGATNPFPGTAGPVVRLSAERLLTVHLDLLLNLSSVPLPANLRLPAGTVVADIDPDLVVRPGPRVIEGAEQLCARLAELR
ncbi:MAG: hypothetical protein EA417_03105 [Gammaproteobacteria bacterium]|nr:MAG: hypothetical protein EA417_03105 [Gammaproteobacteria bacterium]